MKRQIVEVRQKKSGNDIIFMVADKQIAHISRDYFNDGKFCASTKFNAYCSNAKYEIAHDFICTQIKLFFEEIGLNVTLL